MNVVTRQEAENRAIQRYYTGKPCVNGHISERYTSDGACIECRRNTDKKRDYKPRKRREEYGRHMQQRLEHERKFAETFTHFKAFASLPFLGGTPWAPSLR